MMTQSTVARITIASAHIGLAMCTACEAGDKDCALTTGTLELSVELADDDADSILNNTDKKMRLVIFNLLEEPETTANCLQFSTETSVVLDHNLTLHKSFEVPSGWTCAVTDGSYSTTSHGEETLTICSGYLAPILVSGCSDVEASMVITCEVQHDEGD